MKRVQQSEVVFDSDHLAKIFKANFTGQILTIGQVGYNVKVIWTLLISSSRLSWTFPGTLC